MKRLITQSEIRKSVLFLFSVMSDERVGPFNFLTENVSFDQRFLKFTSVMPHIKVLWALWTVRVLKPKLINIIIKFLCLTVCVCVGVLSTAKRSCALSMGSGRSACTSSSPLPSKRIKKTTRKGQRRKKAAKGYELFPTEQQGFTTVNYYDSVCEKCHFLSELKGKMAWSPIKGLQ